MTALVPAAQPDLAAFLARHPWPVEMAARGRPSDFLWTFDLDVSADDLWPWVSDTSRMNRAMKVKRMDFVEKEGVLHGSCRNAGVLQEWVEVPWTWVAGRTLTSVRLYSRGLAHLVRAIYELEPRGEGRVRYTAYFGWIARGAWQRFLIGLGMSTLRDAYGKVLGEIQAAILEGKKNDSPYRMTGPALSPEAEEKLGAHARRVAEAGVPKELVARLERLVREGDAMDLHRIQILPLARKWGASEEQMMELALHATRAGILSLSWDVICPHCRGVREEVHTLGEVPRKSACDVCKIDFETDDAHALEVTFHVHPSIRDVPKLYYCSGEPSAKAHIKVQQRLAPGARLTVPTALAPGRYRTRIAGEKRYGFLDVVDGGAGAREVEWRATSPLDGAVAASAPSLALVNPGEHECTVQIEDVRWSDDALRPARLLSFQEFRDLFSEEYLGADVQLSVGRQTILFTDVVGSTKLYAARGDPGAFMDVKRHFTEIYAEVKRNGGAIVKTIGDAAMAAFVDPVQALRTAHAIQRHFPPGREDLKLRVRISLNTGPCIAVKLNANIDYFGNTVNVAAKLQSLAGAGQVAFAESLLEQPGVRDYLAAEGAKLEHQILDTSSLLNPVPAVRWSIN